MKISSWLYDQYLGNEVYLNSELFNGTHNLENNNNDEKKSRKSENFVIICRIFKGGSWVTLWTDRAGSWLVELVLKPTTTQYLKFCGSSKLVLNSMWVSKSRLHNFLRKQIKTF